MIETVSAFRHDLARRGYPVPGAPGRRLLIADVQRAVAARYGLTVDDLRGPRHDRDLSHPRQLSMYLAKNFTGRSDAEIGRRFGGRDPSTVHDARYKVQRRRILDQELDQAIFELTAVLSSPSTLKEGK